MASLEQLDLLLGEALESLMSAAAEIRALDSQHQTDDIRHIGMATTELWSIRDHIYALRPDMERDFVAESRTDPQRFECLDTLNRKAAAAELQGDMPAARALYLDLQKISQYGWFSLLAEAGLYRTARRSKGAKARLRPPRTRNPA